MGSGWKQDSPGVLRTCVSSRASTPSPARVPRPGSPLFLVYTPSLGVQGVHGRARGSVAVSWFSLELCFLFLRSDWVSLPLSSSLPCQHLQATAAQQCPCSVSSPWGFSLGCTVPTTCSDQQKYPTGHLCLFFSPYFPFIYNLVSYNETEFSNYKLFLLSFPFPSPVY